MSYSKAESLPTAKDSSRWYKDGIGKIPTLMNEILVQWSEIPESRINQHIEQLRSQAFTTYPYPCIGQLKFLSLNLINHELYPAIVSALRNGDCSFLDAGCCLGQELRRLAIDKVPPRALYGLELEATFIELGYELFQDRQKMADATFLTGDLLAEDPAPESWAQLTGKMDFVFANSLLHLFSYPDQLKIACRLASFTRNRSGSLIIGRQVGSLVPGEHEGLDAVSTSFRHSPESFDELWQEAGRLTGTRWRLQAHLDMKDIIDHATAGRGWLNENSRRLHFVLERLESTEARF